MTTIESLIEYPKTVSNAAKDSGVKFIFNNATNQRVIMPVLAKAKTEVTAGRNSKRIPTYIKIPIIEKKKSK
jgi:hypothetical protein